MNSCSGEHEGNRAIRMGNWKLVSKVAKPMQFTAEDENAWELYDLGKDPSETENLAVKYPERVREMAAKWGGGSIAPPGQAPGPGTMTWPTGRSPCNN
ncbi:MAG: hypothetical protein R2758_11125 [Bacteroidales bacterium]